MSFRRGEMGKEQSVGWAESPIPSPTLSRRDASDEEKRRILQRSPITGRPRKTPPAMRVTTLSALSDNFDSGLSVAAVSLLPVPVEAAPREDGADASNTATDDGARARRHVSWANENAAPDQQLDYTNRVMDGLKKRYGNWEDASHPSFPRPRPERGAEAAATPDAAAAMDGGDGGGDGGGGSGEFW